MAEGRFDKSKSTAVKDQSRGLLSHRRTWVRNEAKKYLKKIEPPPNGELYLTALVTAAACSLRSQSATMM